MLGFSQRSLYLAAPRPTHISLLHASHSHCCACFPLPTSYIMSCVHRYTVAVASGFLLLLCAAASGANAELEVELVSWTPDYGQPKPHTIVGKVTGAPGGSVPGDYKVASYVSVGSGWYNRPTGTLNTTAV